MFFLVLLLLGGVSCSPAKRSQYGLIASPNYPKTYPNNNHSTWNISVPEGYHISLKFLVFDIEPSEGCTYDFVKVWADNKELGRFCGPLKSKSHPGHRLIVSEGTQMRIGFQSDFSNEEQGSAILYQGFQAYYRAVDNDECALPNDISVSWTPPCQHVCHNYIGGYFCSCLPGYKLQSDKRTCKVDCSSHLFTEESGYISSPGYPKPYPADLNCNYSIRVEEGFRISIAFVETFDIDSHPKALCPYDTLKVIGGGTLLGTFCGRKSPGTLKTESNKVDILFHTDDSGDSKGWKLHYTTKAVKCPVPEAHSFSIISPNQTKYQFRDYIVVSCETGYQLMENDKELKTFTALCQKDGSWHRPLPRCQIVSCKSPDILRNGRFTFLTEPNTLTYLSNITYSCNEPYYKIVTRGVSAEFTCGEDRIWKDENGGVIIPICVPVCGKPSNPVTGHGRIIKGAEAAAGNFPWQVLLLKNWRGGGILIGEHWVMTAAHVIRDKEGEANPDDANNLHVFIGDTDVENLMKRSNLAVREVHVHPSYKFGYHNHDIALIRLKDPVTMDENTSLICLPGDSDKSLYDAGTMGYVSGFGMKEGNKISNSLKYVLLPMVQRDKCQEQLKRKQSALPSSNKIKGEKFTENMFCAGFPEAEKLQQDSCQGDSGGPYASQSVDKWVATGIVSWGIGCGKGYGYYTKVSNYMDWIKGHLNS